MTKAYLAPLIWGFLLVLQHREVLPQSSRFGYQGELTEAGKLANGLYDLQFKMFDEATIGSGTKQGETVTQLAVPAKDGVFTVTLDFGAEVFDGSARFLEIGVRRAGTSGPYDILAPRQQVASIPYAIRSLNASHLNGEPATSFIRANGDGNVGIGTEAVAPGVRLQVDGPTRVSPGGTGGFVQLGTPNTETGLSIIGSNRVDLRFNGETATLAAGPSAGPPGAANGITINTNGNVGIGMSTPLLASPWKLEIDGATRITSGGSGGAVQFSRPNGESGMSIVANNRADVRFDDFTLKIVAGFGTTPPANENGIAITRQGKVGIGTVAPIGKLHVESPLGNTAAVYGSATGLGGPGVYGSATGPGGAGVYGRSVDGAAIYADGNAVQALDKGGFLKAMAYIDPYLPDGQRVVRCYNSQLATSAGSTAPCGITFARIADQPGYYFIDFGFSIVNRFVSITSAGDGFAGNGINVGMIDKDRDLLDPSSIRVFFSEVGDPDKHHDSRFYIFVY